MRISRALSAFAIVPVALQLALWAPPDLEIRFLDVGQGDAILVREGRAAALIDAGLPTDSIVQALRELGVDTLQLFVASHNHGDHIGAADQVVSAHRVKLYVDNGAPLPSPSQHRVDSVLARLSVPVRHRVAQTITLGDATIDVLPPPAGPDTLQNNLSMVVRIRRGRFSALLTGDSERGEIESLMAHDALGHVDVLKAPHHGDPDAPTAEWLRRLSPAVVVVSVGTGNFGEGTTQAYAAPGRRLFRTDRDGDVAVVVSADGAYTMRTGPRRGR